jgi:hypothetical protein
VKMPIKRYAFVIGFAVAVLFVVFRVEGACDDQPEADIGSTGCAVVSLLEGEATLVQSPGIQRPLIMGETVFIESILQTGGASKVELTFTDHSVVRLNEDSAIELGALGGDVEKHDGRHQVKLSKGEIWVTIPDPPEDRVSPQILVAGALLVGAGNVFRATLFQDGAAEVKTYSGDITASGPFVFVKEGSSFLIRPAGDDDEMRITLPWRYRIEPYRKMLIQASGEETKPFRFTARADQSAWVRWNQIRDAAIK